MNAGSLPHCRQGSTAMGAASQLARRSVTCGCSRCLLCSPNSARLRTLTLSDTDSLHRSKRIFRTDPQKGQKTSAHVGCSVSRDFLQDRHQATPSHVSGCPQPPLPCQQTCCCTSKFPSVTQTLPGVKQILNVLDNWSTLLYLILIMEKNKTRRNGNRRLALLRGAD